MISIISVYALFEYLNTEVGWTSIDDPDLSVLFVRTINVTNPQIQEKPSLAYVYKP